MADDLTSMRTQGRVGDITLNLAQPLIALNDTLMDTLGCGLVIAAESAQLARPEIKLALQTGAAFRSSQRLLRAMSKAQPINVCLSARTLIAPECRPLRTGFAHGF